MTVGAKRYKVFNGIHHVVAASLREGDYVVNFYIALCFLAIHFLEAHSTQDLMLDKALASFYPGIFINDTKVVVICRGINI